MDSDHHFQPTPNAVASRQRGRLRGHGSTFGALCALVAAAGILLGCTSADPQDLPSSFGDAATSAAIDDPDPTPEESPTIVSTPETLSIADDTPSDEVTGDDTTGDDDAFPRVVPEGLGIYLVARPDAGEPWQGSGPLGGDRPAQLLPVYDEPGGEPRSLVDANQVDGVVLEAPLFNWSASGSPTVLRVLAGQPGDEWVQVQSPTRPHDRSVWVRAAHFHWAETDTRIEIDLAGPGELTVFNGSDLLLRSPIVQGRTSRPTPVHTTYLEAGLRGDVFDRSPAYGEFVLMMASFSETMGTFGGGGSPQNFLHGTNQPDLMGQRVSSGEIRMANADLAALVELVHPGVPILIFDSSGERPGRDEVLATPVTPAITGPFRTSAASSTPAIAEGTMATPAASAAAPSARTIAVNTAIERSHPQLWMPCREPSMVCANPDPNPVPERTTFRFAIPSDLASDTQIPVFEAPGLDDQPRTPIDTNLVDGTQTVFPLFPITPFGEPLVLPVLNEQPGWLLVQLPVRPNRSTAWVRASDFDLHETDVFIEISTAPLPNGPPGGELLVHRQGEVVQRTIITPGRDTRPTPNTVGWVLQRIEGATLSPAYGSWVLDLGVHSETLGTFGGGGLPAIALHGTNQPEIVGQRVHSGSVVITNEEIDALASTPGLVGAPVVIHDRPAHLTLSRVVSLQPRGVTATTVPFDADAPAVIPSFT